MQEEFTYLWVDWLLLYSSKMKSDLHCAEIVLNASYANVELAVMQNILLLLSAHKLTFVHVNGCQVLV